MMAVKSVARLLVCIAIAMTLFGCGKPMSNDQIIAEVKKCRAADLLAMEHRDASLRTTDIQCATHFYH